MRFASYYALALASVTGWRNSMNEENNKQYELVEDGLSSTPEPQPAYMPPPEPEPAQSSESKNPVDRFFLDEDGDEDDFDIRTMDDGDI